MTVFLYYDSRTTRQIIRCFVVLVWFESVLTTSLSFPSTEITALIIAING